MPVSEKQMDIMAFSYTNKYQALICDGAVRSGKTSIMTAAFVDWAMREYDKTNFAICGKTVGSAIKNIIVPYMALTYSKKYKISFTRSDNKMLVRYGNRTNTFYIYGGKDESSYMLIQGITLAGVLFDEVALMTRSFVEEALARCLTFDNRRYWFNCNPESPSHWFYQEWIKNPEKHKALHLHFTMRDNPVLSEESIRQASADVGGVFYKRKILGLWVRAEGAIYRQFADSEEDYYIDVKDLPRLEYIYIGQDFGGNKSQHAYCAVGFPRNRDKLYVLRSLCVPAKDTSVEDIIKNLICFTEGVQRDYGRVDACFADSTEQAIINSEKSATQYIGLNVINSIKNEIIDRIRTVDKLLSAKRIFFVRGENDALTNAMKDAVWDEKKQKDVRLDDGSTNIDILDAFEYAFEVNIKTLLRESA